MSVFNARKRPKLSASAVQVLITIAEYREIPSADSEELRRAASENYRWLYGALSTLDAGGLIHWQPGGKRIRPTPAGWQLARRLGAQAPSRKIAS